MLRGSLHAELGTMRIAQVAPLYETAPRGATAGPNAWSPTWPRS